MCYAFGSKIFTYVAWASLHQSSTVFVRKRRPPDIDMEGSCEYKHFLTADKG